MPDPTDRTGDTGVRGADGPAHRLEVDFGYAGERRARVVAESIAVEVGEMPDERSGATVRRDGEVVRVGIDAADLVALRAGANTWVRLAGVAEAVAAACESPPAPGRDGDAPTGADGG